MHSETMIRAGSVLAGLAVLAGAFGAHALAEVLVGKSAQHWDLASRYQMYHAGALLFAGLLANRGYRTRLAGWCFLSGTLIFAGTLYGLALSGPRWLGAITPIGGSLLIVGWASLALARRPSSD